MESKAKLGNKAKFMVSTCIFVLTGVANEAFAQEGKTQNDDAVITTRVIKVDGDSKDAEVYQGGTGIDAGKSAFNKIGIDALTSGTGDVNEILRVLPHVEFDKNAYSTDKADMLDLRPLDISISGGLAFQNNIMIDGIGVVSHLDTTESPATHYDKVASGKAQFQWVDSALIDNVELHDSNISAQYGGFTGGVLNIKTRTPKGVFGAEFYTTCTNSDLISYEINKKTRANTAGQTLADEPDYSRCNHSLTVDLPEIYGFNTMISQTYQNAIDVDYRDVKYGGGAYNEKSTSKSTLLKIQRDLGDFATLDFQYTYAPYTTTYSGTNAYQNTIVTHGSGDRAAINLRSINSKIFGSEEWNIGFTYNKNDGGRDAPPTNLVWPSTPLIYTCGNDTCTSGGFGSLAQEETDYKLNASALWRLPVGKLRLGIEYGHIDALAQRYQENDAYRAIGTTIKALGSRPTVISSSTVCLDKADVACLDGFGALEYRLSYTPYKAEVGLDNISAFAEWKADFGKLETRVGGRVDYSSFLKNTDFSPRLSLSYDFGYLKLTVGANRYYEDDYLGYALNEQKTGTIIYYRNPIIANGKRQYSNSNWIVYNETRQAKFTGIDLKTPYSDELTAALNFRLPYDIDTQIKFIYRDGKDEFAYQNGVKVSYVNALGVNATYSTYVPNNDGQSHYEGISLELNKRVSNNLALIANAAWSETRHNVVNYMTSFEDSAAATTMIYYNGSVMSLYDLDLITQAENFATPLKINVGLVGKFFNDNLKLGAYSRWSDAYKTIDSLGFYTPVAVGNVTTRYLTYGKVKYSAITQFDINGSYRFINQSGINVMVEGSVTNLFSTVQKDEVLSASEPYQKGRTIWLGLRVKY